jgi:hypothetical protein
MLFLEPIRTYAGVSSYVLQSDDEITIHFRLTQTPAVENPL